MPAEQRVLLIVPHQDDEILCGGGLLKQFVQNTEYEIYVVYTTNGDYFAHEADMRIRESLHVLTKLYGIEEAHIYLLGYGNEWKGATHLYNAEGQETLESVSGRIETYGSDGHEEYRQMKSGYHSVYCRDNFKKDLKELLEDIRADIIIAVDYDKHPDHKAASLMTEECVGELLIEMPEYRPTVLKRFAYDGVWKGKADFFEIPRRQTVLSQEMDTPYSEEDKICIAMPPACTTPYLGKNFLYKVLKCYRTQEAWQKADEIINIDEVYWKRRTDNLLYEATLTASSGEPEYIRDFKLFDCADVLQKVLIFKKCAWLPESSDCEKEVRVHFPSPKTVERINLYARGSKETDTLAGEFIFDTGLRMATGDICLDGRKNSYYFEGLGQVQDFSFRIIRCTGSPVGITQMEVFSVKENTVPEQLQQFVFEKDMLSDTMYIGMVMKMERFLLQFKRKISRWIPNEYVLRRYYPQLQEKDAGLLPYRIKYILERIKSWL